MNDTVIPTEGEMSRKHRIILGGNYYGLYVLGMATSDFERTDEDCAMDNMRVPRRYEELTDKQRESLRGVQANEFELERLLSTGESVTVALDPLSPIDISGWTVKPALKLFIYNAVAPDTYHAVVQAESKEEALQLMRDTVKADYYPEGFRRAIQPEDIFEVPSKIVHFLGAHTP